MGVVIENAPVRPAIVFDRVNMLEMRITIPEAPVAKAAVRIVYKLFGVDEQGVRHFDTAQHVLTIEDAFTEAQTNPALAQAMLGIEQGLAAILTASGQHGSATQV